MGRPHNKFHQQIEKIQKLEVAINETQCNF